MTDATSDGHRVATVRLGFGCVRLGSVSGGRSLRSEMRLVQNAIDGGITLFDTADAYGNGVSERILGRAVRGHRADVTIATKIGYVFDDRSLVTRTAMRTALPVVNRLRARRNPPGASTLTDDDGPGTGAYASQDFSVPRLRVAVDASLGRLRTDYIDVLQLHGPPTLLPDVVDALTDLVRVGKVRSVGVGAESIASARDWSTVAGIDVVQLPFGVLDPDAAHTVFESTASSGVEIWARGVFGGGLLASPVDDHPKAQLVADVVDLARTIGVTPYELAFDYARSFTAVSAIVIGIHSTSHLAADLRLLDRPPADRALIDRVDSMIKARTVHDGRS